MLPLNHGIDLSTLPSKTIITTSSVYHQLIINKQQQTRRRRTKTPTITTITPLISVNITNITASSFSSSTSSTPQQQISFEESYSPKTGIKIAAILGGMLLLVILYVMWKGRARLFRSRLSSSGMRHPRLSTAKFDLDYWLKQVDLLEAKEAERNRGGQLPYLELPNLQPRDNREATASWIVDAYHQWRLMQYRQRHQGFQQETKQQQQQQQQQQQSESNPVPYRRRRYLVRRFLRRFLPSSQHDPSYYMEHSQSLIAGMRPSIVSNHFIPPSLTSHIQLRRASSWPCLKSNHHQTGVPMSALQTHLARKRLLKRTSRTTFDI